MLSIEFLCCDLNVNLYKNRFCLRNTGKSMFPINQKDPKSYNPVIKTGKLIVTIIHKSCYV